VNRGLRSQAYRVDLGHGAKPWVVVSNNARNRNLDTVLAARITTTGERAHVPTVGPLTRQRFVPDAAGLQRVNSLV